MSENTNERDAEAEPGALRAKVAQAVAPSSDEVRARLHAAREAKGKAPVDCWACEAFDEVIALLWEMHQAGYEQGLAGYASTAATLKAAEAGRDRARSLAATLEAQLAQVEAALANEPLIVWAIRREMERSPGNRGGSLRHQPESFNAKTGRHFPASGCPGDNVTLWLDDLRAILHPEESA